MRKQILLPPSVFRELYQTFKVHRVILSRALKYERNSKRDQMLRAAALERGGLIYTGERAPQGYCPNVETRHNDMTVATWGDVLYSLQKIYNQLNA